jgi:hypothetical protein
MAKPFQNVVWLHHTDGRPDLELPGDWGVSGLAKGVGIVLEDGERHRVVDLWLVLDPQGEWHPGWHAIIEPESSLGPLVHVARQED